MKKVLHKIIVIMLLTTILFNTLVPLNYVYATSTILSTYEEAKETYVNVIIKALIDDVIDEILGDQPITSIDDSDKQYLIERVQEYIDLILANIITDLNTGSIKDPKDYDEEDVFNPEILQVINNYTLEGLTHSEKSGLWYYLMEEYIPNFNEAAFIDERIAREATVADNITRSSAVNLLNAMLVEEIGRFPTFNERKARLESVKSELNGRSGEFYNRVYNEIVRKISPSNDQAAFLEEDIPNILPYLEYNFAKNEMGIALREEINKVEETEKQETLNRWRDEVRRSDMNSVIVVKAILIANVITNETMLNTFINTDVIDMIDSLINELTQDESELNDTINLQQAREELWIVLGRILVRLDSNYQQYETIEEMEKVQIIYNYFVYLKNQYLNFTTTNDNPLYNDLRNDVNRINAIKDSIIVSIFGSNDRETFAAEVPDIIDDFISQNITQRWGAWDHVWGIFSVALDVIGTLRFSADRIIFLVIPGAIIEIINGLIASIGTDEDHHSFMLSMEHILFNQVAITDINIFDLESAGNSNYTGENEGGVNEQNVLVKIRRNIASWYYAIRNLAIALALLVLIYVGIRMATSTIADERAKYKKMLVDWLVSFALIFVLHYIMIFIIQLNDGIVAALEGAHERQGEVIRNEIPFLIAGETLQGKLLAETFSLVFVRATAASLLYLFLSVTTLFYLIVYIKRFITISFLVIISPLITVTYAIDKAGDGKAQALNKWLKEFTFNILIQPFHCIIYMVVLQDLFYVVHNTTGVLQFGKLLVALILALFIYKAEDIVKTIFGIKANNLSSAAVIGAATLTHAKDLVKKGSQLGTKLLGVNGNKANGGTARDIKNIPNPSSLPSGATTPYTPTPKPPSKWETSKVRKWVLPHMDGSKHSRTVRGIFMKAALGTVGLAAKGDYSGAVVANAAGATVKSTIDQVRADRAAKKRQEDTRVAYDDYKGLRGYDTTRMITRCDTLLDADITTITDVVDRNLAGWLQAEMEAQKKLGLSDVNAKKAVLDHLREHEGII